MHPASANPRNRPHLKLIYPENTKREERELLMSSDIMDGLESVERTDGPYDDGAEKGRKGNSTQLRYVDFLN